MIERRPVLDVGRQLAWATAGLYGLALVSYLAIPAEALNSGGPAGAFFEAVIHNRVWFTTLWGSRALAAVLALGVVLAAALHVRPAGSGWLPWLSALGLFGFALVAIDDARFVSMVPVEAAVWADSDDTVRSMIAGDFRHLSLAGDWLKLCPVGAWLLGVSAIAGRANLWPTPIVLVGIAAGVGHLGLGVEDLVPGSWAEELSAVLAGGGGAVWFAGLGLRLGRAPG